MASHIERRKFLATLGGAAAAWPLAARAQPSGRLARVGILTPGGALANPLFAAFRQEMRRLGYVEGRNLILEFRSAADDAQTIAGTRGRIVQAAARDIGQQFIILNASSERDIDNAFAALLQKRTGALIVSTDPFLFSRYHQIVVLAAYHKLPTIYDRREFVAAGGLISYGTHLPDVFRQIGIYAGRILKGEKPGDLPVMLPTKFEFVINLKAAKALGLEIPDKLLALADEVIE
jgi:putative ABC transport system substrate-binding protein